MSIEFSNFDGYFNITTQFDDYDKPAELTELEVPAIDIIKSGFANNQLNFNSIKMVRRTKNYLSLILPNDNDFCRIKAGVRSNWISLDFVACSDDIKNDTRLEIVKNKHQRHWKIQLNSIDRLNDYMDLIIESYKSAFNN